MILPALLAQGLVGRLNLQNPQPSVLELIRSDPVGFVAKASASYATDKAIVERLHDFKTNRDLFTLRGSAISGMCLHDRDRGADIVAMRWGRIQSEIGLMAVSPHLTNYRVPLFMLPKFDPGPPQPAGADPSIAFQVAFPTSKALFLCYAGPRIIELSRKTQKPLGKQIWGTAESGGYNFVNDLWSFSARWNSFAVAQEQIDGMALASKSAMCGEGPYEDFVWLGKFGGPTTKIEGQVAGIVPCTDSDGFHILFTCGECRTYVSSRSGRYKQEGPSSFVLTRTGGDSEQVPFAALGGVADAAMSCVYTLTADRRRLAIVKFAAAGKPSVSFVAMGTALSRDAHISTVTGSHWLTVEENMKVTWFEKTRVGLTRRFQTVVAAGQEFIPLGPQR